MEKEIESKYYVDNGREYISFEDVCQKLGLKHMELMRLIGLAMPCGNSIHDFNKKSYLRRENFENFLIPWLEHLKKTNTLNRIQWKLPEY